MGFFSCPSSPIMRKIFATMTLKWLPDVEDVSVKARTVTVKGPRGTLTRSFKSVSADIFGDKAAKNCHYPHQEHDDRCYQGLPVQDEIRVCAFPRQRQHPDAKDLIEIRNFLGEKVIRRVQ